VIRIIEGFETAVFKSKFDKWPQAAEVAVSEEGRGKVAGLCSSPPMYRYTVLYSTGYSTMPPYC
jgi:hypothetical protein